METRGIANPQAQSPDRRPCCEMAHGGQRARPDPESPISPSRCRRPEQWPGLLQLQRHSWLPGPDQDQRPAASAWRCADIASSWLPAWRALLVSSVGTRNKLCPGMFLLLGKLAARVGLGRSREIHESPAELRITRSNNGRAAAAPSDGASTLEAVCLPWSATRGHEASLRTPPRYPLASGCKPRGWAHNQRRPGSTRSLLREHLLGVLSWMTNRP